MSQIDEHLEEIAENLIVEHLFYTISIATNNRTTGIFFHCVNSQMHLTIRDTRVHCLMRQLRTSDNGKNWQEFWFRVNSVTDMETGPKPGIILCMHPANEKLCHHMSQKLLDLYWTRGQVNMWKIPVLLVLQQFYKI